MDECVLVSTNLLLSRNWCFNKVITHTTPMLSVWTPSEQLHSRSIHPIFLFCLLLAHQHIVAAMAERWGFYIWIDGYSKGPSNVQTNLHICSWLWILASALAQTLQCLFSTSMFTRLLRLTKKGSCIPFPGMLRKFVSNNCKRLVILKFQKSPLSGLASTRVVTLKVYGFFPLNYYVAPAAQ